MEGKTDMEENRMNEMKKKLNALDMSEHGEPSGSLESQIKEFGLLSDMKATENFLIEHPGFINESTALMLLKWCSASAQSSEEFNTVSTQTLYILYLLDLARQVDIEPVHCVAPFFSRISEPEFYEMFEKEIVPFREKLQSSSWDEVFREVLKPDSDGSSLSMSSSESDLEIDPWEMYQDLPPNLQACIDNEDIQALEAELNNLPDEVADEYMTKFIKARLFIPIDEDSDGGSEEENEEETQEADEESRVC